MMLVTATSPTFVTVPVKTRSCPGVGCTAGHALVSTKRGVVVTAQVRVALAVTKVPHTSDALAVRVSVKLQTLVGTR